MYTPFLPLSRSLDVAFRLDKLLRAYFQFANWIHPTHNDFRSSVIDRIGLIPELKAGNSCTREDVLVTHAYSSHNRGGAGGGGGRGGAVDTSPRTAGISGKSGGER